MGVHSAPETNDSMFLPQSENTMTNTSHPWPIGARINSKDCDRGAESAAIQTPSRRARAYLSPEVLAVRNR